jgi:CO dehydrogenase/acetyl-CoA synthase beta subunit
MELFREQIDVVWGWLEARANQRQVETAPVSSPPAWPGAGPRNLVIGPDVGVELGHPKDASVSLIIWGESGQPGGRVHRVGPDLPESEGRRLPFAKVVLIGGKGFDAENTYERYRRLASVRYDVVLEGYMMRAVSQVNREWSRVSREALAKGFTLEVLGGALVQAYSALAFVDSVDILFVTSSRADVLTFQPVAERVSRVIAAMNRMGEEMNFDCDGCSYADVCQDVAGLRAMRRSLEDRHA